MGLPRWVSGSNGVWVICLPCLWAPMAMPAHLPPPKVFVFWTNWWRRVWTILECHQEAYTLPSCFWGEFFLCLSYFINKESLKQYFQRLYILDSQVQHLDSLSELGFGHWLSRKWVKCQERKQKALTDLRRCNIPEEVLRSEWKAQVAEQTKPIQRKSAEFEVHWMFMTWIWRTK